MTRLVLVLLAALAMVAPAAAGAAEARTTLPDVEDEVMCLECGTPLNVSTSAVADQQREFISELIAQGRTKEQVKDALVAEYGPRVLGVPEDDGFGLAAYLVPVLLGAGALALVLLTARRWRRAGDAQRAAAEDPLDPDDARRLDAELAAFDR